MIVIGEDDRRFITIDQGLLLVTLYVVNPVAFFISFEVSKGAIEELIEFLCEGSNGDFALRVEQEVDRALVIAFYSSSLGIASLVGLSITLNLLLRSGKVSQIVLNDLVKELFCISSLGLVGLNLRVEMVLEGNS